MGRLRLTAAGSTFSPEGFQLMLDQIEKWANVLQKINGFDIGASVAVFGGGANSATLTVTHAVGRTPVIVVATGDLAGISTPVVQVGNFTATTFDILVHDADAIARTGNTTVYWLAIG